MTAAPMVQQESIPSPCSLSAYWAWLASGSGRGGSRLRQIGVVGSGCMELDRESPVLD